MTGVNQNPRHHVECTKCRIVSWVEAEQLESYSPQHQYKVADVMVGKVCDATRPNQLHHSPERFVSEEE
jgi:hypothetical protein